MVWVVEKHVGKYVEKLQAARKVRIMLTDVHSLGVEWKIWDFVIGVEVFGGFNIKKCAFRTGIVHKVHFVESVEKFRDSVEN